MAVSVEYVLKSLKNCGEGSEHPQIRKTAPLDLNLGSATPMGSRGESIIGNTESRSIELQFW